MKWGITWCNEIPTQCLCCCQENSPHYKLSSSDFHGASLELGIQFWLVRCTHIHTSSHWQYSRSQQLSMVKYLGPLIPLPMCHLSECNVSATRRLRSHASPLDPNADFTILEYRVHVRHFSLWWLYASKRWIFATDIPTWNRQPSHLNRSAWVISSFRVRLIIGIQLHSDT